MKKLLALLSAAAILFACGCGSKQETTTQTEAAPAVLTQSVFDDDLALPADNEGISATAPVVQETTQPPTTAPTTAPTTVPTTVPDATTTAPVQTTAPAPTDPPVTEPPATEKPTETTTQAQKTAELFEKRVLGPVNSGKYTMTLGMIGDKNQTVNDKIVKTVRDGEAAYWITIPGNNGGFSVRVFPNGGKYYAAIPNKYSELTKEQYDALQQRFDSAFGDFSAHQYQDSKSVRERLKRYTIETFDQNGKTVSYWFENSSLFRRETDGFYQPFSVSDTPMYSYFDLDKNAEEIDTETMGEVLSLAGALFE